MELPKLPSLLSINNYYYRRGGAEVVFLEQNKMFEEIGWQVFPFAMQHPNNLPSEWAKFFPDEIEFGESYSFIEKASRAFKITYSLEARKKLGRLLDMVRPDIAHAHNIYHHLSPSILSLLKARGIPTVLTLHDLKIACPAYKMLTHDGICERCKGGAIWNVALHRCVKNSLALSAVILMESSVHRLLGSYSKNVDRFIVPSRFFLEKFVEWGWPRDKIAYIPNFVNVDRLKPQNEIGNAFIYFGRLGHEKGLETFIRALKLSGLKGWIVGTGPDEGQLRRLVAETGAEVKFLGYLSGEKLFDAIRNARATVLPSEWYENAPISVLESYALERPVIGANIGGIPELVRAGVTGETFQSGDAEALADRMARIASLSNEDVLTMGKAGRSWVTESFTSRCYLDRVLSLYREIGGIL